MQKTFFVDEVVKAVVASTHTDYRRLDQLRVWASQEDRHEAALTASRFIETGICDGSPYVRKVTEEHISRSVDMADCEYDETDGRAWFYLDDDGALYPVMIGQQDRLSSPETETSVVWASSAIVANGKQVGTISYTDH